MSGAVASGSTPRQCPLPCARTAGEIQGGTAWCCGASVALGSEIRLGALDWQQLAQGRLINSLYARRVPALLDLFGTRTCPRWENVARRAHGGRMANVIHGMQAAELSVTKIMKSVKSVTHEMRESRIAKSCTSACIAPSSRSASDTRAYRTPSHCSTAARAQAPAASVRARASVSQSNRCFSSR